MKCSLTWHTAWHNIKIDMTCSLTWHTAWHNIQIDMTSSLTWSIYINKTYSLIWHTSWHGIQLDMESSFKYYTAWHDIQIDMTYTLTWHTAWALKLKGRLSFSPRALPAGNLKKFTGNIGWRSRTLSNSKDDHLGSNHQAKKGDFVPICLSPWVAQLWSDL